jgi:phage baseplate assembly protein V
VRALLNSMRQEAAQQAGQVATVRVGTVTSYDAGNYAVKVTIEPEGATTGWIPIPSPWTGNGWGMFCPPSIGDRAEIDFIDGDMNAGVLSLRFFGDSQRPLATPSGEFWLVHQSGSLLKFHNDGSVEFKAAGILTSSATAWNHTGPVNITGNVLITGTETVTGRITGQGGMAISGGTGGASATVSGNLIVTSGDVTADAISLKTHTHSDPQGGTVGPPS